MAQARGAVTDAVVNFGNDQHLDTLDIGPGGKVVFAGAHLVVLNHLVMDGFDFGAMAGLRRRAGRSCPRRPLGVF